MFGDRNASTVAQERVGGSWVVVGGRGGAFDRGGRWIRWGGCPIRGRLPGGRGRKWATCRRNPALRGRLPGWSGRRRRCGGRNRALKGWLPSRTTAEYASQVAVTRMRGPYRHLSPFFGWQSSAVWWWFPSLEAINPVRWWLDRHLTAVRAPELGNRRRTRQPPRTRQLPPYPARASTPPLAATVLLAADVESRRPTRLQQKQNGRIPLSEVSGRSPYGARASPWWTNSRRLPEARDQCHNCPGCDPG